MLCFVVEMTENESRLEIFGTGVLPDCFKLRVSGLEKACLAWLLWREGNYVGVSFQPPGEISAESNATQPDAGAARRA